jgi:hypothetical protein
MKIWLVKIPLSAPEVDADQFPMQVLFFAKYQPTACRT